MESITLLKYKYQCGSYSLLYMISLVQKGYVSKEQFKQITRLEFVGVSKLDK